MASRRKPHSGSQHGESSIDWGAVLGPLREAYSAADIDLLDAATQRHPRRALRLSPGRVASDLPLPVEQVAWHERGYFVAADDVRPGEWLHYAAGDFYIQDAGSLLPLTLAEISPDQWVCDVCAAPGGKATGALEQLTGTGLLVANEVIGSRLAVLHLALARTGQTNYLTTSADAEELAVRFGPVFDCVIVDAPCTGQTMVSRGKQVLAAYSRTQIEHSALRQRRIVDAASQLVAPGGRLVYSTCAFSFAENEAIVQYLCAQQPEWHLRSFPGLQSWESPGYPGCYRLWPHRDGCGGAFAAAIVRPGDPSSPEQIGLGDLSTSATPAARPHVQSMEWWRDSLSLVDRFQWRLQGKLLQAFPIKAPTEWLPRAISGTPFAERLSDRIEPHYASAWLCDQQISAQHNIELDDNEAARYVAGEAINRAGQSPGWARMWWRGKPLGWTKVVAGVLKNHYPKPLRSRLHA